MTRYWIRCPGWFYAGNFYGHTEAEARAAARKSLGVARLPKGTEVWK